jgi:GT2 family glycosyltransferase
MFPEVSIILLNWNGWQDTLECLESLYQINYPSYQVIVVDNDSQDDSLEKIRAYCRGEIEIKSKFFNYSPLNKPIDLLEFDEEDIRDENPLNFSCDLIKKISNLPSNRKLVLIKNKENYGFAKGNNIGIKFALESLKTSYTLLLNNDTVVDKEFLKELIQVAESDDEIALVGSKIYYYDLDGKDDEIWCAGGKIDLKRYPGHYGVIEKVDLEHYQNSTLECDWISGAAMLIKSSKIPFTYLNEDFFFGCEDADLALRLKEQGYKMMTAVNSKVWHKIGFSRRKKNAIGRTFVEIKTSLKFIKRHNKYYLLYLPLYLGQIIKMYSIGFFKIVFNRPNDKL